MDLLSTKGPLATVRPTTSPAVALNVGRSWPTDLYPRPSCGFLVFGNPPGSYEICPPLRLGRRLRPTCLSWKVRRHEQGQFGGPPARRGRALYPQHCFARRVHALPQLATATRLKSRNRINRPTIGLTSTRRPKNPPVIFDFESLSDIRN